MYGNSTTLTWRKSGRYPRLAKPATTPAARRGPDLLRIEEETKDLRMAWGEAPALRETIWMLEGPWPMWMACVSE